MTTYVMEAKENYDPTLVAYIAGKVTAFKDVLVTNQQHQGIQWDPINRNLMYLYCQNKQSDPSTNTTGFTLWDGETSYPSGHALSRSNLFNTTVALKNIDSDDVVFYNTYDSTNTVPVGIGGSDGTWRRTSLDFVASGPGEGGSGPGMTDPYTSNFWIKSQSCELYCFRAQDSYKQTISPLYPQIFRNNGVKPIGFTTAGATGPWTWACEIDSTGTLLNTPPNVGANLYLIPKDYTAEEIAADYLLPYATFQYPRSEEVYNYSACNREIFDHAGNMYLFSCASNGGKDFKLHKFTLPTSAPYGGPTVGGGFTDITPWGPTTGPNADAVGWDLIRQDDAFVYPGASDVVPMYLPATDDLVLISKFLPSEHTLSSEDPSLLKWSCTYVHGAAGSPTFDHHSDFVTGYMSLHWTPTSQDDAYYSVMDAFEVNRYLGQTDYDYGPDIPGLDYTKRWFFFVCNKVVGGVSDNIPRIVLVEYHFVYGSAPVATQVIDEQGWDDTYPTYGPFPTNLYHAFRDPPTAPLAASMDTGYSSTAPDTTRWDNGLYDPVTNSFWWSGNAVDPENQTSWFGQFDTAFADRMMDGSFPNHFLGTGTLAGPNPPFLKLSFGGGEALEVGETNIHCWAYTLDGHDYYVMRLGDSATLVYDITTKQWAEWQTPSRTNWRPIVGGNWQGMTGTLIDGQSDVVAGDDVTGVLWRLGPTKGRDDLVTTGDVPFTRKVVGGISVRSRDVIPCNAIELTVALGDPTQTGASIQLEFSDDFGHTWVDCGTIDVTASDFDQVIEWRSLGLIKNPGRIFRFTDDGGTVRYSGVDMR